MAFNSNKFEYNMGLKFRIYPSHKQEKIIQNNFNAARAIYNQLIENSWTESKLTNIDKLYPRTDGKKRLRGSARIRESQKFSWLSRKDLNLDKSNILKLTEGNYRSAWNMFRKVHNAGTPNFKKKSNYHQSYNTIGLYQKEYKGHETPYNAANVYMVDKRHIRLPKLGSIRTGKFNMPNNEVISLGITTVSQDSEGVYYVSLTLRSHTPFKQQMKKTNKKIGVDLNLDNFYTDSNGNVIDNPKYFKHAKNKLKQAQRIMSRRQRIAKKQGRKLRYAKNYQAQRKYVAELHACVRHQRENFLHNLSTTLIKNHDLVVAEELRSKNMMKNRKLAMSIADVGWRTFLSMCEYKAQFYDKTFVTVSPRLTTQTCSDCGITLPKSQRLTLNDREWVCPECNEFHIRDHNAARNILNKGIYQLNQ